MWTETAEGHSLITEISKIIVADIAPEELDLFDELISEYFKNPTPPSDKELRDDPLGFGINEIVIATTTATAAMVKATLAYLTTESIKAAKEEGADIMKGKIKSLFNQKTKKDVLLLNKDQLKTIHKLAIKQAIDFGISQKKAENMAKALIGTLSMKR